MIGAQSVDLIDDIKALESTSSTVPPVSEPGRMQGVSPVGSLQHVHNLQKVLEKISVGMKWWQTNNAKQMQPHLFGIVENG